MGNVASCAPAMVSTSAAAAKVLLGDGKLGMYTVPVTAAELMLENPGKFVCDPSCLKVGHRVPGLSADEELQPRHLYYLLPIEMLYSVLTNEELSCLREKASRATKDGGLTSFSRIFPVFGDFCMFPNAEAKRILMESQTNNGDDDYLINNNQDLPKSYPRQRSWRPKLETIFETPPRV